jgi:hypothetical protein
MNKRTEIIKEINTEIDKLVNDRSYRQDQNVWAEEKQFKNIKKSLSRCSRGDETTIQDFSRVVSDSAPMSANISKLTDDLYDTI